MFSTYRSLRSLALLTSLTLLLLTSPAMADSSWQLRVGGTWFDSDGGSTQSLNDGEAETSIESDLGLHVTTEYRVNDRVGIEFGALLVASPELLVQIDSSDGGSTIRDDFNMHIFGAGINFHLTPDSKADLYFGPFIGQAIFSDLVFVISDEDVRFGISDEMVYGAVLGLDVPLNDHWNFNATARYYDFDIEPRNLAGVNANTIDLSTVAVSLGLGYRF